MTIFIFYEAPKRSRVFLFHLIQLLISFEKEFDGSYISFHYRYISSKRYKKFFA